MRRRSRTSGHCGARSTLRVLRPQEACGTGTAWRQDDTPVCARTAPTRRQVSGADSATCNGTTVGSSVEVARARRRRNVEPLSRLAAHQMHCRAPRGVGAGALVESPEPTAAHPQGHGPVLWSSDVAARAVFEGLQTHCGAGMIDVALPDGPAGPLVRGLAACLSSVTELPLHELPELEDLPLAPALGACRSWLAGHGAGLVPVHDPRRSSGPAGGSPSSTAATAPSLTAPGARSPSSRSAHPPAWSSARRTPRCSVAPPQTCTCSSRGAHRPRFELTLIAAEVVEDLTERDAARDFAGTRRNVLTRGSDVNALVGRDFTIGDVCTPTSSARARSAWAVRSAPDCGRRRAAAGHREP